MAYIVSAYIVMAYILPRCVDIRASSGISGNPQPPGPLCCMWPMGTSRGAKLHLGGTLADVGPVGHGDLLVHTTKCKFPGRSTRHAQAGPQTSHKPAALPGFIVY